METRKNTLRLAFAQAAKVPIHLDVLRFMMRVLKIPATDVHSVYKDENDQRFYVKFMDEASFNRFGSTMEDQYWFQYADGEKTRVQLEMASRQFKYIRIFNLPPETEDKDIAAVLGQFGRIRQHVRERYPTDYGYAVFSGVRGVHMEIEREIPANLYIGHFRARLYYEGLKNKCFFCKAEGHNKSDCPKLADSRDSGASGSVNSRLYSQVAANLKIATDRSAMADTASTSMTVLQVPQHPSSKNAQHGATGTSPTAEISAVSGGAANAVAAGASNAEETTPRLEATTAVQVTNTTTTTSASASGHIDQSQTMETDGALNTGKEENVLKRPPLSASDSSDMETEKVGKQGKKIQKIEVKPDSRSRSNSRQSSKGNSRK